MPFEATENPKRKTVNIFPIRFETLSRKIFIGRHIATSLSRDSTRELWRSFMPLRNAIPGRTGSDLFSVQEYPAGYFERFDPSVTFRKWAAAEVSPDAVAPAGMDRLEVPPGEYAVFLHKGPAALAAKTFGGIYMEWLPASEWKLDQRPHFEILTPSYSPDDPMAEEEVFIPVTRRQI